MPVNYAWRGTPSFRGQQSRLLRQRHVRNNHQQVQSGCIHARGPSRSELSALATQAVDARGAGAHPLFTRTMQHCSACSSTDLIFTARCVVGACCRTGSRERDPSARRSRFRARADRPLRASPISTAARRTRCRASGPRWLSPRHRVVRGNQAGHFYARSNPRTNARADSDCRNRSGLKPLGISNAS